MKITIEANVLRPCPECGGDNVRVTPLYRAWRVICFSCGARGPLAAAESEAVTKWNEEEK